MRYPWAPESVGLGDLDPAVVEMNEQIKAARQALGEAKDAADEQWAATQEDVGSTVEDLRKAAAEFFDPEQVQ